MYTLFSSGRFSCVFKDRLLILTGSLAVLTGILSLFNRAFSIFLPWVLSLMGVSILALMVYDRTHNMKTLLTQGAVPHSERLMTLLETHREVEEKARVGIEDHIWIEQRLINALAIEVREANSPVVQMLLTQILEEEKGHHAVLQRIFNLDKDYAVNRVRGSTL